MYVYVCSSINEETTTQERERERQNLTPSLFSKLTGDQEFHVSSFGRNFVIYPARFSPVPIRFLPTAIIRNLKS